jgi:hypothetical protein
MTRLRWIVLAWLGRKVWSTWRRRRAVASDPETEHMLGGVVDGS